MDMNCAKGTESLAFCSAPHHRTTAPTKQTYGESTPGTKDGVGSILADAIGGKLGSGRGELNDGLTGRKGRGGGGAEDHDSGDVSHRSFYVVRGTRSVMRSCCCCCCPL